jgi:hypothetical protein
MWDSPNTTPWRLEPASFGETSRLRALTRLKGLDSLTLRLLWVQPNDKKTERTPDVVPIPPERHSRYWRSANKGTVCVER